MKIRNKQEFRQAVSQYLNAKAKGDLQARWTKWSLEASRLSNMILCYAHEMQRTGKCSIAESVVAMPTYGLQCRMADNYMGSSDWIEALKAIESTK